MATKKQENSHLEIEVEFKTEKYSNPMFEKLRALEAEMKDELKPIEYRLDSILGFKESVRQQCKVVCKEVEKLTEMFKKFEIENQPLIKDLPVFLESEKKTF